MATHEPVRLYRRAAAGSERNFGIVFAVVFSIVAFGPAVHGGPVRWWGVVIGVCFLVCGFFAPRVLKPLNFVWFKIGIVLHHIINPIIMAVMFFGAIMPMALFLRLLGKDLLRLRREPENSSYWIPREPPAPTPGSMSKQF